MRLSEEKIFRIAERIHDELGARDLVRYRDPAGTKPTAARGARIRAIVDFITADLKVEEDIDTEVEKILDSYSRVLKATERDVLRRKHKEDVARRRNYEL